MSFDFKNFGLKLLALVPYIVAGIQQIHTDANGATKKQLALESLGFATTVADNSLPADQAALANAISGLIDNTVSVFHATNMNGFGTNALAAAPVTGSSGTVNVDTAVAGG